MASVAERARNFANLLCTSEALTARASPAYRAVVGGCLTEQPTLRRGLALLDNLPYIGDRAAMPADFDETRGVYASVEEFLGSEQHGS